jgi:histidine triad (HIT) family protein
MSDTCIFCRIVRGEIEASRVHEDEHVVAFRDVDPKAPTHILVVPRRHIASVTELGEADVEVAGRLLLAGRSVAIASGIGESGYRLVLNTGEAAGQSVDHIHLHVLGGRPLHWPPG